MAARHYGGAAAGLGLSVPLGGALIRSNVVAVEDDQGWKLTGIVNADVSVPLAGTSVYLFAEYFHNGFGVGRLPGDLGALPQSLADRLARGESFNLMRNYLALGAQLRWQRVA